MLVNVFRLHDKARSIWRKPRAFENAGPGHTKLSAMTYSWKLFRLDDARNNVMKYLMGQH